MPTLPDAERAFAENLILRGAVSGARLIHPILLRTGDPRPLWELVTELQLAPPAAIAEARELAEAVVQAMGAQAFSFSEGALVGPWELEARRGHGVGGEVWLAGQPGGRRALVRVIPPGSGHDPERTRRFVERSNVGFESPHPAVLKIDEADEDFGWLYAATLLPGEPAGAGAELVPLAGLLERSSLSEAAALEMGRDVAEALGVIHGLGVVHGGLSPLALIARGQRTCLSDFGVCAALLDGPVHGARPGSRLGMLLYADPDLIAGDAARGLLHRDDLYALGAVLYHAVCAPASDAQPASPHAPWAVEPPVSSDLRAVLVRLLAPPGARYASAAEVQEDLARLATGLGPAAPGAAQVAPVRALRAESARPQELLRPDTLRAALARAAAPAPATPVAVTPVAVTPVAVTPVEVPPVHTEPAARRQEEAGRRRRSVEAPQARPRASLGRPAARGGGWMLFFTASLLVFGGLALAHVLTEPEGSERGRARLNEAFVLLGAEAPRYDAARARLRAALPLLDGQPGLLREALILWDEVDRRALDERTRLLPVGDGAGREELAGAREPLEELLARSGATRAAPLLRHDLARAEDALDPGRWAAIGEELVAGGHPALAGDAFRRAHRRAEQSFAEDVLATLVFLRGGPYLVPDAAGGLATVERAPRYIGRTEVTRAEYARFLAALAELEAASEGAPDPHRRCDRREPVGKDHRPAGWTPPELTRDGRTDDPTATLPASGVDLWDALAYAGWRGLELADGDALAAAARGPLGLAFPWGGLAPGPAFVNAAGLYAGPTPAGALRGGAGASGALDLLGNLAEWLPSADGAVAVTFGGHYETPFDALVAAECEPLPTDERRATVGFRVMKTVAASEQP